MFKVVFDTNIFVSAIGFGGIPKYLYESVIERRFILVTSPAIMAEIAKILRELLQFDERVIVSYLKQIARTAEIVKPTIVLNFIEEDPSDNRILECAVAAKANLIVSGDKHLLRVKEYDSIQVVRAIGLNTSAMPTPSKYTTSIFRLS